MATKRKSSVMKGEKVPCQDLRKYLYGIDVYRQASMLRKGREVHKIYVDVHKGLSFLDDRFSLTEFGRMVLENGSVRAGRARNVRQIVVARETLYCSGTGGCQRGCGGQGQCLSDCEKAKVRGHKCSFRVKLTMRLGFVDHWFVEVLGSHNSFKDEANSPATSTISDGKQTEAADYSANALDNASASPSSETSDDLLLQRDSPVSEVASLLRQNGASAAAAAAAALCEQFRSSPPILYLSPASHLNIPVFPEPFSISAQHHRRHQHHQAVAAAAVLGTSQPQVSSLDLRIKPDPESAATTTASVHIKPDPESAATTTASDIDNDSPMELTTKGSSASTPTKNGHAVLSHKEGSSWSERNELLKSYMSSDPAQSNGGGGTSGGESYTTRKYCQLGSPNSSSKKYWTYQFSAPELTPTPSPMGSEDVEDRTIIDDTEDETEGCLVIDDDAEVTEHGDVDDEYEKDLMVRVQQLEAHVTQLRNIVLKSDKEKAARRDKQRQFDFNKYNTRHVALKVAYLGWDYQGFVVQEDTERTIEAVIFDALLKTRLVESREKANYHRCGRTDKGVSAFGQVISLDMRTNLLKGPGVRVREGGTAHLRQGEKTTEIRYVHILNKVLPPEVRILAWAPVEESFSARFSCKKRTYKYYFPKGNLDLQLMSEAASKLIGEHDFRNLCKMDVGNGVTNFKRRVLQAEVNVLDEVENGYRMCELVVVGQAFLWHQIRCIVAILFLIAQGKEELEIIDDLLNVDKCPRKPQYTMASELPLVLYDCDFGEELEWVFEADWHEDNIRHLQQLWAQHAIKATMLKKMLDDLDLAKVETESDIAPWNELSAPVLQQSDWVLPGNKPRTYKSLLSRQTCESLEERIEHYAKRRKTSHPQSTSASAS
ncbi:hypothetical protein C0Q70_03672 [Pomacea canaliculata]|uniref:Pseudouridine synthase I TruA alpha/beta domain-containing protein n=1 Tax=Pomacea canaliculata TaxID=400727 RepID=A0A2T7PTD6_POMCA|nr:uncharacterized protein LOC112558331 [Pomacea canaliculata]XP_025084549.1 uncharacterized protein LOC112558331 [Pomacea canaliculata]XP_025084550.1 uncharacterized protein LOC112558331 [Pomacea canaliculata]XP_025084551.1 uncharacterized protein LOC112558331 [Pomacea canaliculata]PVD36686.1 hypothetical protein C0Q70_03672 [Pomacea canaliculata]